MTDPCPPEAHYERDGRWHDPVYEAWLRKSDRLWRGVYALLGIAALCYAFAGFAMFMAARA